MDSKSFYKTNLSIRSRFRSAGPARLVSDLLNPLLLPAVAIAGSAWLIGLDLTVISWIAGAAIFFYTLIPLTGLVYLLKTKAIHSLDLPERKSRTKVFILSIISGALGFLFFTATASYSHPYIAAISFTLLVNMIIALTINSIWKMSIHTATLSSAGAILLFFPATGDISAVLGQHIFGFSVLLLLLVLLMWSRLYLEAHTLGELLGGTAAGFLFTITELVLLVQLW